MAQGIPGLPSLTAKPAASAASAAEPTLPDWMARLEAARAEHRQLLAQPDGSAPLLAQRQVASARRLVLLTARVDALRDRAGGAKPTDTLMAPVTPLAGPPYSLLEVDRLRDQLDSLTNQRTALQMSLKALDGSIDSSLRARDDARASLRLRRDRAARPLPGTDTDLMQAELELADITAQAAELELTQADEGRRRARDKLSALEAPIAERQAEIERVRGQVQLDEAALRKLLAGIAGERKQVAAELARLGERLARSEAEAAGSGTDRGPEIEALRQTMQLLGGLESVLLSAETVWQTRREAIDPALDEGTRRAMADRLDGSLQLVQEQRQRLAEEGRLLRAELRRRQATLASLDGDEAARAGERRVLEALQLQADARERLRDAIDRLSVLGARTRADLGVGAHPKNASDWLHRAGEMLGRAAAAVWQYELFSATETRRSMAAWSRSTTGSRWARASACW